jgi:hypothetical protein
MIKYGYIFCGGVTYYPQSEQDFNLAKIMILDTEYPITYGSDSSLEQVVVQTVVINNTPVGLHVIAPFEVPTYNKANVLEIIKAVGKAANALNDKCQEPEKGFWQMLEAKL